MKKLFIIANWKSNKTEAEVKDWLSSISRLKDKDLENKEIIVCPSFLHLSMMKTYIAKEGLPIKLGAQNISPFDEGPYTGEVNGKQIKDLAEYALIGHSERKKYFHETENEIVAKLEQLIKNNITPILCIRDMKQMDYYLSKNKIIAEKADDIIFVYEPPGAISTQGQFHAESPEIAEQSARQIGKKIGRRVTVLYGGSVNPENVKSFFSLESIDGGLVGQASFDPLKFLQIIENA